MSGPPFTPATLPTPCHPSQLPRVPTTAPTFREALRFWLKLGFISFGGPAGQIAIMHTELVERRRWIDESRFLHALNYCMLLPGPEAQQLATYCGTILHGTRGGLVAGILFVLPAVFILWALSFIYVTYGSLPAVAAVFSALKPAVLAIIVAAVFRIGKKALLGAGPWAIAAAAFVALFFLKLSFPLVLAAAALTGWLGGKHAPRAFPPPRNSHAAPASSNDDTPTKLPPIATQLLRVARTLALGLTLWWAPVALAALCLGPNHSLVHMGLFFSKAAVVTFGGAYAVLPYVGQQAVEHYGWLTAPQMLDGLAFAETTPGPLIMVLQHVGFLGGWSDPAPFSPLLAATLGALMTTWVTFVPCFLWIFLGAPYIDRLRHLTALTHALNGITAAVVGVILNLALWFALHILVAPTVAGSSVFASIHWPGVALASAAFVALHFYKLNLIAVIAAAGAIGLLAHFFNFPL